MLKKFFLHQQLYFIIRVKKEGEIITQNDLQVDAFHVTHIVSSNFLKVKYAIRQDDHKTLLYISTRRIVRSQSLELDQIRKRKKTIALRVHHAIWRHHN